MFIAYFISQILIKIRKSVLRLLFVIGVFLVGCYLPEIKEGYPWCINIGFIAAAFILAGYLIKELTDKRWSLGIMIAGTMIGAAGTWMYHLNSVNVEQCASCIPPCAGDTRRNPPAEGTGGHSWNFLYLSYFLGAWSDKSSGCSGQENEGQLLRVQVFSGSRLLI